MIIKNRKSGPRKGRKASKKASRPTRNRKSKARPAHRKMIPKKPVLTPQVAKETQTIRTVPAREGAGFKITVEEIDKETVLGDLIVVFPRTREVLRKHGLRLDVEHAGDIYMTLDAFSALQGLKTDSLIAEIREVSKEPVTPATPVPQLIASAT